MQDALACCARPAHLRRTLTIALVVGFILSLVNQADSLIAGEVTWVMGLKLAANFIVPFVVSNLGLLAGRSQTSIPTG